MLQVPAVRSGSLASKDQKLPRSLNFYNSNVFPCVPVTSYNGITFLQLNQLFQCMCFGLLLGNSRLDVQSAEHILRASFCGDHSVVVLVVPMRCTPDGSSAQTLV